MRAELLKLRYSRIPIVVSIILAIEVLVVTAGTAWLRSGLDLLGRLNQVIPNATEVDSLSAAQLAQLSIERPEVQSLVVEGTASSVLGMNIPTVGYLLLGALFVIREFRNGTAARTVLTEPDRAKSVASKVAAVAVLVAILAAALAAVRVAILLIAVSSQGAGVQLSAAAVGGGLARSVLAAVIAALVGVALGYLVRSQTPILVGVIGWVFVESTITSLAMAMGWNTPLLELLPLSLLAGGVGQQVTGATLPAVVPVVVAAVLAAALLAWATARFRRSELSFLPS